MPREIEIERLDEDYDPGNDAITLKVDGRFLRILVPKDGSGYLECAFDDTPDGKPLGLNLVCPDHYT